MPTIAKKVRCSVPFCDSCQRERLLNEVHGRLAEAGIDSLYESSESEVDNAVWDEVDAAAGLRTREVVQRIITHSGGDYFFAYPHLTVDSLALEDKETAERLGAEVTWNGRGRYPYYSVKWELFKCGLFSTLAYRIQIDELPWKQLRREAVKYDTGRGKPTPKGYDLLRCMMDTARHQYSNYEEVLSFQKSLARPFKDDGVRAIRGAFNDEIERIYPNLKVRN